MSAGYVLVNVEPGSESEVHKIALTLDCVTDANMLFGDYDLIVKIEADSMGASYLAHTCLLYTSDAADE